MEPEGRRRTHRPIKSTRPETPVVLFSAYGSPEIEQAARQRGIVNYWEQGMRVPTLLEPVRALGIPGVTQGNI